ncbi:hypothetical protein WHR41_02762 [Cladosporium halotolerans]|uniref:Uncharacterized protein n=1 Tax=Cladosporium halotolerans TaxID=1052096 RepID=A0AB34KVY5_9PEZI
MPLAAPAVEPASHLCYFSYKRPVYDHSPVETALSDATCSPSESLFESEQHHLLLAHTDLSGSTTMATADLLKLQTAAAHGTPIRPRPVPQQNLLQVTSDDSSSSSSSSMSMDAYSAPEIARCSRCQRTPSHDTKTGKSNMVQYGLNLWYCSRCASMVGFTDR